MKKLSKIIEILKPKETIDFQEADVKGVAYLSQNLGKGDLFCCVDEFLEYGRWMEGETQLEKLNPGDVSALVLEKARPEIGATQILVEDSIKAMGVGAKFFYDNPDESLKTIGITGTNGKTTTTHLIKELLGGAGSKSSCMGTNGVYAKEGKLFESEYTTPLATDFFKILSKLKDHGIDSVAAEISSHALKLNRAYGLKLDAAIFSNISRDHLDFHPTLEDYVGSKKKLFQMIKPGGVAVINMDDPYGAEFQKGGSSQIITYGLSGGADLTARNLRFFPDRTEMEIIWKGESLEVSTNLSGRFNVYNVLSGVGAALGLGIELGAMKEALESFQSVDGRMEIINLPGGRVGIVDYSHTPDALKNVLKTIRETTDNRIITVFGCGGDRDPGKRSIMGEVASTLSDLCIVTSDNPRTEDPMDIIKDIVPGLKGDNAIVAPERREAIIKAYEMSLDNDVILVAGKGHETYQIHGIEKIHFDDREELRNLKGAK